jgi:TolB protein
MPRISPNGRQLTVWSDDGKEQIVWVYDLNGATPIRRLTFGGRNRRPLWTADGHRIAFASDREGNVDLFWQRADGSGTAELLGKVEQDWTPQPESWTPDGKTLVFSLWRGGVSGGLNILSVGADQKPKTLIPAPAGNATLSPDGRWLAYNSTESGSSQWIFKPSPVSCLGKRHLCRFKGS